MKLYLFLRSLVWTAILSVAFIVATLIAAFTNPDLVSPFGMAAIAFAVLTPSKSER